MRIFSTFHDYYDGVQQHGFDDHVVYERKTVTVPLKPVPNEYTYFNKNRIKNEDEHLWDPIHTDAPRLIRKRENQKSRYARWPVNCIILYFCGKIYPFFQYVDEDTQKAIYSFEAEFEKDITQEKGSHWNPANKTPYKQWLSDNMGKEIDPGIHFYHQSPIILFHGKDRIINPCLKDYRIQKVIDPYTAFQEIDMFMGGVLGSVEKEGPVMTDKEKVSAHGMDPKWSFRKHPDQDK